MPDRPYTARRSAGTAAEPPSGRQARHSATTVLPATRARRQNTPSLPEPEPTATTAARGHRDGPWPDAGSASTTRATDTTDSAATPASLATDPAGSATTPVARTEAPEVLGEPTSTGAGATAPRHRRWGALAGASAAAVVVLAGVVFLVYSILSPSGATSLPPDTTTGSSTSAGPATPALQLTDAMMVTTTMAAKVVGDGDWTIASDTTGPQQQDVTATCLRTVVDQPAAIQERTRTLTAGSATTAPAALHQAFLYASEEQAAAAYAARLTALGGCATSSALLVSGATAKKLGDEAAGVIVDVQDSPAMTHTVWIGRTGPVVNVVDFAVSTGTVTAAKAAGVLAALTDAQCTTVDGTCSTGYSVAAAPPPASSTDGRGLLVLADIPSLKGSSLHWALGASATNADDLRGTQCEGMDLGKVSGTKSLLTRSYLLADDPDNIGIDMVVYTMGSAAAAKKTAATISGNIGSCQQLTATVSGKTTYAAPKGSSSFSGTSYVVTQQLTDGKTSYRYRVSVSAVGKDVVYLFTNVTRAKDFSNSQWTALSIRAAQRAAQA